MSRSRTSIASLLKIKSLGSVGVIAVLAFYVAWPLYAGYEIKSSLETQNSERLAASVDFPSVRISLRPAVARKVDAVVSDALRRAGTAGAALSDPLKARIVPPIVEGVLASLITPEMLIRIHASGKSLKDAMDSMVLERASKGEGFGGLLIVSEDEPGAGSTRSRIEDIAEAFGIDSKAVLGGVGAKAAGDEAQGRGEMQVALEAKSGASKQRYGFDNIKHFALNGPLGLSVGVARDPKASRPDFTAEMAFLGGSWKLTGLVLR